MGTEDVETSAENHPISFTDLIEAAVREDWAFVEEQLKTFPLEEKYFSWALHTGLKHEDRNVRDIAVTFFNVSNHTLTPEDMASLYEALSDEYHVVRIRAAMAMRSRGSDDPIVEHILRKAADEQDPDLGVQAQACLDVPLPKFTN